MLGSSSQQHWLSKDITGLANQDYENWMNHALSLYNTGMNTAGDIFHTGYQASSSLADQLGQNRTNQAQLAYSGQDAANQHAAGQSAGFWGNLANLGIGVGAALATGGII